MKYILKYPVRILYTLVVLLIVLVIGAASYIWYFKITDHISDTIDNLLFDEPTYQWWTLKHTYYTSILHWMIDKPSK